VPCHFGPHLARSTYWPDGPWACSPPTKAGKPGSMVAAAAAGPNPASLAMRWFGEQVEEDPGKVGIRFEGSKRRGTHGRGFTTATAVGRWGTGDGGSVERSLAPVDGSGRRAVLEQRCWQRPLARGWPQMADTGDATVGEEEDSGELVGVHRSD
jgi:hypothetical protein